VVRNNDVSLVDVAGQRIARAGTDGYCSAHEGFSEDGLEQHRALRSYRPTWRQEVLRNGFTSLMPDVSVWHEKPPLSPCHALRRLRVALNGEHLDRGQAAAQFFRGGDSGNNYAASRRGFLIPTQSLAGGD